MKKILLIACLTLSSLANAELIDIEGTKETASPFPNAKKGINIMSLKEMNMPEIMKDQTLKNKKALTTKGYEDASDTDENVISLFSIQRLTKKEVAKFDNNNNPYDTHLKSSSSKLKLAFNFKDIPGIKKENIIGYAAAGGYAKDKGWDGIVEFISDPKLGACSYTTYKIEKVILDKETLEYDVNNKPSSKSIAGNWNVGFLYVLSWYMPDRLMTLKCANKMFNANIMGNMITLANSIDKLGS